MMPRRVEAGTLAPWQMYDYVMLVLLYRDDDDINDVASMAGVNLSEESARIMATNAEFIGTQMRSIKEEKFLIQDPLHQHVNRLCESYFSLLSLELDIIIKPRRKCCVALSDRPCLFGNI